MSKTTWYNITEAAEHLQVSRQTIYNLIERAALPYYEIKGVRGKRIKEEDLDALLKRADMSTDSKQSTS